jgi:hypothetical protein
MTSCYPDIPILKQAKAEYDKLLKSPLRRPRRQTSEISNVVILSEEDTRIWSGCALSHGAFDLTN